MPNSPKTPRTRRRTKLTTGAKTNTTKDIGRETLMAALSALVIA